MKKRFVKLFSDVFVKEIIERNSTSKGFEDLFDKLEAKVSCTVCKKRFAKKKTLEDHMKSHIECSKCGKGFKKEVDLEKHKTLNHNSRSKTDTDDIVLEEEKCNL